MVRRRPAVVAVLGLRVVLVVAGVAPREGSYTAPLPTTAAQPTAPTALPPSPVLGQVLLVLVLLLAVAAAGRLITSLVRTTRDLARTGALSPPRAAGMRSALAPAAEAALRAVEQPDAREAVVRSWLLLGDAAAAAGLPVRPAETAAEYAARVVTELDVPGPELDRLADLYREARFSQHEVGERQRAEARELLRRLRDRLEQVPA